MKTLSTSSNASDHVGTDMELSSPDVTYCNNNVTDIHQHTRLSQPAGSNTLTTTEKIVQVTHPTVLSNYIKLLNLFALHN